MARYGVKATRSVRSGVAAVEFAALLPLLTLLLLGVWEVGRMVEVQQILTNAAREGGRQAATGIKSSSEVKSSVVLYLKQNGVQSVSTSDVTLTNLTNASRSEPTLAEQLDEFNVSVSIPFDSVRWVILDQITTIKTLTGSAHWYSMRDIPITVNANIPLE